MLFSICLFAQNWQWAHSLGSDNLEYAWDVATDYEGNVYVTGSFVDSLAFGDTTLYSNGLDDIYVLKFSSMGNFVWARSFGSSEEDTALSIATDELGNIYITGYHNADMTVGDTTLAWDGLWDAYVIKLDPTGNAMWATSFGGDLNDIGYGVAVSAGKVFVTGWFASTMYLDDDLWIQSYGGSDIYLACFSTDGDALWVRKAGDIGVEYGFDVCTDNEGNPYITGVSGNNTIFGDFLLPGDGGFIARYDSDGNFQWANRMHYASVNSIGFSQHGYVTGRYNGMAGFGDFVLYSIDGGDDIYYAAFDAQDGTWLYVSSAGGAGSDRGRACVSNTNGLPVQFLAGSYSGSADLFGYQRQSAGGYDIYVFMDSANEDSSGYEPVLITAGGENDDIVTGVANIGNEGVVICGWHFGQTQFGDISIDSGSTFNANLFVARYNISTVENAGAVQVLVPQPHCYPNPFQNSLNIKWQTQQAGHAVAEIYNLRG
ncbi:MAG: SBBP repeat-containing protein, partial [Candidatus Cloacimonadaceae bacterium]|nr:SBBP repeat-containing protein [Candidatus Cloacimonadaceae bacterium]